MSAFGTFPYAPPKGLITGAGRCPNPRSPRGRGCRRRLRQPLHPNHRALGRLQPVKAKPLRGCFASLDRFPAPSASDRFAIFMEMERGQGRRSRAFLPLMPWNRPNTSRRRGVGGLVLPPAPAASEWGLGQSPQNLFGFRLLRLFCRYP